MPVRRITLAKWFSEKRLADRFKKKLRNSIPAYLDARTAFDKLTSGIPRAKLSEWRKMEQEALRNGGTQLEQLYTAQIERSEGG